MTVNCESYYRETVQESLQETERFVEEMRKKNYSTVQPIITPRFAVTCDMPLMTGLAEMARKYDLPIQTHLSENLDEIATVKGMNPTCRSYTEIYERAGLLTNKTLLAHGIHLDDEELDVIRKHGASIIHCPSSNCFLQSGVCDTIRLLDKNVNIGLGTDMGAGYSPSILEIMRRSVDVSSVLTNCRRDFGLSKNSSGPYSNQSSSQHSNHSSSQHSNHSSGPHSKGPLPNSTLDSPSKSAKPLNFERAFYLATMGGAKALNLDGHIGNFACGKRFDALVINMDVPDSPLDFYQELTLQEKFLKFFFTGDDRNIQRVYVDGKLIRDKTDTLPNGHTMTQTRRGRTGVTVKGRHL
ncbi:guanine deaminase-like [Diaphorina citri]|uniref:Guanine deaminase-like n=1 Tax=Diaphorina citri TaxID=121845 RepID=A0A3Q0J037_DIACI|nr:guanine deaminase-like [Diaphorina citri]XP_026681807.1 guanine deaminase-like [Diaphorina citri]